MGGEMAHQLFLGKCICCSLRGLELYSKHQNGDSQSSIMFSLFLCLPLSLSPPPLCVFIYVCMYVCVRIHTHMQRVVLTWQSSCLCFMSTGTSGMAHYSILSIPLQPLSSVKIMVMSSNLSSSVR